MLTLYIVINWQIFVLYQGIHLLCFYERFVMRDVIKMKNQSIIKKCQKSL